MQRPRLKGIGPIRLEVPSGKVPSRTLAPPLLLLYGFLGLITLGTLVLSLPISSNSLGWTDFTTAFFTATSAATITGLVVVDTPAHWSLFGQVAILLMVFIGGLGFMTAASFLLIVAGQKITLSQRMALMEPLGVDHVGGIIRLTRNLVYTVISLQALGAVTLFFAFVPTFGKAEGAWQAIFHSVSAFNNAGFTVLPESNSMSMLVGDYFSLGIIMVLIVMGGMGFFVIADMLRLRRPSRFSLDTKIVLAASTILLLSGWATFLALESYRDSTLGNMSLLEKIVSALFHSVTARTAGFSTVPTGEIAQATMFFIIGLMFVGSASISAGGGIRVNTAGVLVATVLSAISGKENVTAFGREISHTQVHRGLAITIISASMVFLAAFALTFTEDADFIKILFETVSAFGTVGLSTGITPDLSNFGRIVIIASMFIGRLGPLTFIFGLIQKEARPLYRMAEERVRMG